MHELEHRDFVDRINLLHRRFDDNPEAAARVVNRSPLEFLQDWRNRHIPIEDMDYRPHVEQSPAARESGQVVQGDRGLAEPLGAKRRPTPPPKPPRSPVCGASPGAARNATDHGAGPRELPARWQSP